MMADYCNYCICLFLQRNILVVAADAVIITIIIIAVDEDPIIISILLRIVAVVTRADIIGVFVSMSVDMSALVFVANN